MLLTSLLKQKQVMFQEKVGKASCSLKFVHIENEEEREEGHTHAHLIYRCTQEAHLVVCGPTGGMLTTKSVV